jgi:protein ImuB
MPVHVQPSSRAIPVGEVVARAGPWRTSGHWWSQAARWDRDEWDVEIAGGGCYRLARLRSNGQWEVEAEID